MANSSHVPSGLLHELRPGALRDHANGKLRAVVANPAPQETEATAAPAMLPGNQSGPRKLVRPKLPPGTVRDRAFGMRGESPILAHQILAQQTALHASHDDHAASHAEAFYFQKQAQTQTLMVFVLEDGEHLEGYIEWYDRDAIKIRNGSRTLVYKSAIKYLYKAGDLHG
jgi:sRNA-binding regulator protein Hfq